MTPFDNDNDGDKDLMLGGVSYPCVNMMTNGDTPLNAWMTAQDTAFPGYNVPIDIPSFPGTYYFDYDGDDKKELVSASNNTTSDKIDVVIDTSSTTNLAVNALTVDTQANSQTALAAIDAAIATISQSRAGLGAMQNRLHVANENNASFAKNLSAAVGRIRDVDVAQATADLARTNVLTQAGIAVLAQANQAPNQVLSLLRQRAQAPRSAPTMGVGRGAALS